MNNSTNPSLAALATAMLRAAQAPDFSTAAATFAHAGIPVFPCVPGGKQPLTPHGFHDASADIEQVKAWWRHQPDANLALPTGAVSGVDVVDVDVHPNGTGFPAFERARRAGLVDGWAWLVRTPSGGVHAYFLRTEARAEVVAPTQASMSTSAEMAGTSSCRRRGSRSPTGRCAATS